MERGAVPSSSFVVGKESSSKWMSSFLMTFVWVVVSPSLNQGCENNKKRWKEGEHQKKSRSQKRKVRISLRLLSQSIFLHPALHWPLSTRTSSCTSWEPQTEQLWTQPSGGRCCYLHPCGWWAVNWSSKRERERHPTNRVMGFGFFCDSFPCVCPLGGRACQEKRSNPTGSLY